MKVVLVLVVLLLNLNNLACASKSKPKTEPETKDPPAPISLDIQATILTNKRFVTPNFRVYLERNPANNYFELEWDCDYVFGSRQIQLEGDRSPRIFESQEVAKNINFSQGMCILTATLHRNTGEKYIARKRVKVGNIEDDPLVPGNGLPESPRTRPPE